VLNSPGRSIAWLVKSAHSTVGVDEITAAGPAQ